MTQLVEKYKLHPPPQKHTNLLYTQQSMALEQKTEVREVNTE